MNHPILLSISETCRALSISRSGVYRLISAGHLRPVKVSTATRFLRADVEAYVAGLAAVRKPTK